MADFILTTNTKAAVRALSTPFADISTFDDIIQAVMNDNPFGCTAYEDGRNRPRRCPQPRTLYRKDRL